MTLIILGFLFALLMMSSDQIFAEDTALPANRCDSSYPDVCILSPPPDLDCKDIPYTHFRVSQPDPHGFDADKNGIGCEESEAESESQSESTENFTPLPIPDGTDVVIALGTSVSDCKEKRTCYDPFRITVGKYSTITWFNADNSTHTVTSGSTTRGPDGLYDSDLMMSGTSFSYKFEKEGVFNYVCTVHPWMTGQIIIERGGVINELPTETTIPVWVKNIAGFWCDDEIDDTSFIGGIQYLIDNDIITVTSAQSGDASLQDIPPWVKSNACWWSEGLIGDKDFASGIEFLVLEGIIQI